MIKEYLKNYKLSLKNILNKVIWLLVFETMETVNYYGTNCTMIFSLFLYALGLEYNSCKTHSLYPEQY